MFYKISNICFNKNQEKLIYGIKDKWNWIGKYLVAPTKFYVVLSFGNLIYFNSLVDSW